MSELKLCPFCGSDNIRESCLSYGEWYICENCSAENGGDGVRGWNTRPIEDALRAENEKLKEALREIASHKEGFISNHRINDIRIMRLKAQQALNEVTK